MSKVSKYERGRHSVGGLTKTKTKRREEVPFMLFILVLFQRAPCYLGELPWLLLCNLRPGWELKLPVSPGWSRQPPLTKTYASICKEIEEEEKKKKERKTSTRSDESNCKAERRAYASLLPNACPHSFLIQQSSICESEYCLLPAADLYSCKHQ